MISFLFPGFLYAAGAVAMGVVALHFLVTQQPRTQLLPTARFFPDVVARSTSLAVRPSDLLLLLLRVVMILLIGLAFAQPQLMPGHRTVARLVAVDVSDDVGSRSELADSAAVYLANAAALVLFDSSAREVPVSSGRAVVDSLRRSPSALTAAGASGSISSALIALLRAAARARDEADSLELVVISPFTREEADAAMMQIRDLWPGHLRVVQARPAVTERGAVIAESGKAAAARVMWADSGATDFWERRPKPDTIGGLRAGAIVLVYPFERRWRLKASTRLGNQSGNRVHARWIDGEPAVIERDVGGECVRSAALAIPEAGDVPLRSEFVEFLRSLSAACLTVRDFTPLPTDVLARLEGRPTLAPASLIKPRETRMTPMVPWLLAAALMLVLVELLVRERRRKRAAAVDDTATIERHAA
jgi:hypothetical protein